jgi:hypothetical protein
MSLGLMILPMNMTINTKEFAMRTGIMTQLPLQVAVATETIEFQSNATFFKELTEYLGSIRDFNPYLEDEKYFNSPEVNKISEIIAKHTGLKVVIKAGKIKNLVGIRIPFITPNHILDPNWFKYYFTEMYSGGKKLLEKVQENSVRGSVDLKQAKVSGVFTDLENYLEFDRAFLSKQSVFTPSEAAATILHEIGHVFTYLEFLNRVVSTNQVLAGMVRSLDKTVPDEIRKTVLAKGADLVRMNDEQRRVVLNSSDEKEIAVIVMDAAIYRSRSELGCNIYDSTSSEYLADQFCTRMGAGKDLVLALDKFNRAYAPSNLMRVFEFTYSFIRFSLMMLGTLGLWFGLLIFSVRKSEEVYDTDFSRFNRIRHQNTEWLKDKNLPKEKISQLIKDNEEIDKVISLYKENLPMIEKIAIFFRPNLRALHKYENLQKELEDTANSKLFDVAAKFTIL